MKPQSTGTPIEGRSRTKYELGEPKRCAKCGARRTSAARYCRTCATEANRQYREANRDEINKRRAEALTEEKRLFTRARAYVSTYLKRGKVTKEPCVDCGGPAGAFFDDPRQPLGTLSWRCPDHARQRRALLRRERELTPLRDRFNRDFASLSPEIRESLERQAGKGTISEESPLYRQRLLKLFELFGAGL